MKKFIFTIILTLMAGMTLTSCIDSAIGNQLSTMLKIKLSQDLLDACDIEITYKGKGGVDVVDTITTTTWRKIIVNDSFPTEVGFVNYRLLIKPDAKFDKDRCQLRLELTCQSTSTSIIKEPIVNWTVNPIDIDDIASSKVAAYLELHEVTPSLFNNSIWGFHSLAQKVSINNGQFEVSDAIINTQEPNKQEPSKETER